ncbi:hypothetical protein [Streptomyces sp. NPDC018031]|uniref:hypothetical protein n=1 Tax=Streptomyces sp. NPDC018031 TaxID=3365033 RepID=UPI0037A29924
MLALLAIAALLAAPTWVIVVVVKLLTVALPGRRPDWGIQLLRWGAGMLAVAAVLLLAMALGAVEMAEHESESGSGSSPAPACRDAAPHLVGDLVGHRASYLPPAFDCVLDDGTTYPSSESYAWLNGLVVTCAATSALLAVGGRLHHLSVGRAARSAKMPATRMRGTQ